MVVPLARRIRAAGRAARACGGVILGALLTLHTPAAHADSPEEEAALSAGGIAGEILDTAVEHCRQGERAQALAIFKAIREQMAPPPGIRRLIDELEATGCQVNPLVRGSAVRLRAGAGWDSNVSQGISARTLGLGSGENAIELELDPSYRPRSSSYATVSVDYGLVVPQGIRLQASAGLRHHPRASSFDLATVSLAASRELSVGADTVRGLIEVDEVWLGSDHYQRSQTAAVHWLRAGPRGAWLATLNATSVQYLTQPSQDAFQWELGLVREHLFSPAFTGFAGLTLLRDHARGARPGGDRQGWHAQLGALVPVHGWRIRPQLLYSHWDSAEVFAPGLIDVHRRNRLVQGSLQLEKPLSPADSLWLEWRGRWARDTVALYRYKSQVLSATLERRF